MRHVAASGVVGARLIGQQIGHHAAPREFGDDVGAVGDEPDGERLAPVARGEHPSEGLVERIRHAVAVARLDALADARGVDVDAQKRRAVHGRGQRLRAAHAAEPAGDDESPGERSAEMRARRRREGLVGALQDALRADVDPRTRGHLAVHHQPAPVEVVEDGPVGPLAHEIRVGDQHAGRVLVRAHDAHGLARLHEQRLVVFQVAQRAHDRVEAIPVARGLAASAVHDQIRGVLADAVVEVVEQHA